MSKDYIIVRGARQHNLKNVDLDLPRGRFIVFTGLSGSGKSSLAFDTIYAEGQRRYVESLSAYARQFLGVMDKPDVDLIAGLSPAISIDQKSASHNPRSTVGTVTEIHDYLRLLYARVGHPHCHLCGRPISSQTVDQMVDRLLALPAGTRLQVLAPLVRGRKGEHQKVLEDIRRAGFVRVRVDGEVREAAEPVSLDKNRKHHLEAVVDRLAVKPEARSRLAEALETALHWGEGLALVEVLPGAEGAGQEILFSRNLACPDCGVSVGELEPRLFSFNSPFGACPVCAGLGVKMEVDPDLVIPDRGRPLAAAVAPWSDGHLTRGSEYYPQLLRAVARHYGVDPDRPLAEAPDDFVRVLLYGSGGVPVRFTYRNAYGYAREATVAYEGVIPNLERRYREAGGDWVREEIEAYMTARPCPACGGRRLRPEALAVTVGGNRAAGGRDIGQVAALSIREALDFFASLRLTEREETIARQVLREIQGRLGFLVDVGLDYLSLDRPTATLSGGEAQRIRLATQIGSGLTGVLYVLDEPSIGLHQRDNARLIATLERLRDQGNTVIVVEHDEETIRAADWVVDIGPGAGEHGGRVVYSGPVPGLLECPASVTGRYLAGRRPEVPPPRRRPGARWLEVRGASQHNLKDINVRFPLGLFVCVTGVSGSGKSTLVREVLYRRLAHDLQGARVKPGAHAALLGGEHVRRAIEIDQSPIGRTPRSNPATYTGVFDLIRQLFALTPEARMRGYKPGRFSFNLPGGRCEACKGDGIIRIEMHFLADVYVPCEVCHGRRYNRETLEVRYDGRNVADVLAMTVEEALRFFHAHPGIRRKLETMRDVGLGYIRLGQPAPQLSGGEAQRVKLAAELWRRSDGGTVYILDEPTTGLHAADVERLLAVLQRLVDAGDTVIVIEHNLDVIRAADWIIDLGPEGGEAGGRVVAEGPPEEVALREESHTGRFLRPVLERWQATLATV